MRGSERRRQRVPRQRPSPSGRDGSPQRGKGVRQDARVAHRPPRPRGWRGRGVAAFVPKSSPSPGESGGCARTPWTSRLGKVRGGCGSPTPPIST